MEESGNWNGTSRNPTFLKQEEPISSHERISAKAQELVDQLNVKRTKDEELVVDFKKAMDAQVSKSCSFVEKSLHNVYVKNSGIMESKMVELFTILGRIAQLEEELKEFKNSLSILYQDVSSTDQQIP